MTQAGGTRGVHQDRVRRTRRPARRLRRLRSDQQPRHLRRGRQRQRRRGPHADRHDVRRGGRCDLRDRLQPPAHRPDFATPGRWTPLATRASRRRLTRPTGSTASAGRRPSRILGPPPARPTPAAAAPPTDLTGLTQVTLDQLQPPGRGLADDRSGGPRQRDLLRRCRQRGRYRAKRADKRWTARHGLRRQPGHDLHLSIRSAGEHGDHVPAQRREPGGFARREYGHGDLSTRRRGSWCRVPLVRPHRRRSAVRSGGPKHRLRACPGGWPGLGVLQQH